MLILNFGVLDSIALFWFCAIWLSYHYFSLHRGKIYPSLQGVMHHYRKDWMVKLLARDQRIGDITALGNLERNASFFASSSLLIMAGIITMFGYTEEILAFLYEFGLTETQTKSLVALKIVMLACIFVYAFFSFTWCMRQYGFIVVMVGAAPMPDEKDMTKGQLKAYSYKAGEVIDLAGKQFNQGLRAYYFGLALLSWFIHPVALICVTTYVCLILFRREFYSKTLRKLMDGRPEENKHVG